MPYNLRKNRGTIAADKKKPPAAAQSSGPKSKPKKASTKQTLEQSTGVAKPTSKKNIKAAENRHKKAADAQHAAEEKKIGNEDEMIKYSSGKKQTKNAAEKTARAVSEPNIEIKVTQSPTENGHIGKKDGAGAVIQKNGSKAELQNGSTPGLKPGMQPKPATVTAEPLAKDTPIGTPLSSKRKLSPSEKATEQRPPKRERADSFTTEEVAESAVPRPGGQWGSMPTKSQEWVIASSHGDGIAGKKDVGPSAQPATEREPPAPKDAKATTSNATPKADFKQCPAFSEKPSAQPTPAKQNGQASTPVKPTPLQSQATTGTVSAPRDTRAPTQGQTPIKPTPIHTPAKPVGSQPQVQKPSTPIRSQPLPSAACTMPNGPKSGQTPEIRAVPAQKNVASVAASHVQNTNGALSSNPAPACPKPFDSPALASKKQELHALPSNKTLGGLMTNSLQTNGNRPGAPTTTNGSAPSGAFAPKTTQCDTPKKPAFDPAPSQKLCPPVLEGGSAPLTNGARAQTDEAGSGKQNGNGMPVEGMSGKAQQQAAGWMAAADSGFQFAK